MRKNKMMRAASGLLVAVLLTTCIISGTFAKYTSTSTGQDQARVARWGFNDTASINLNELFKTTYDQNVTGEEDVIAPGTTNSATFRFDYSGTQKAPEVAYTFKVDTIGSDCATSIQNNKNIQWKLDSGEWGTWSQMIAAIEALDGNVEGDTYAAGVLPTAFNGKTEHTVSWQWKFDDDNNDVEDTKMGNETNLAKVKLVINVTATQIN